MQLNDLDQKISRRQENNNFYNGHPWCLSSVISFDFQNIFFDSTKAYNVIRKFITT